MSDEQTVDEGRLEEVGDQIQRARDGAKDILDDDERESQDEEEPESHDEEEREFHDSGETPEEDDQTIAPPG
jgi:hypothetical protein